MTFHHKQLARPGQQLDLNSGLPDLFADLINEHWCKHGKGYVVAFSPSECNSDNWKQLGYTLLHGFILSNDYTGIYLDGDTCSDKKIQTWIELCSDLGKVRSSDASFFELRCDISPHPVFPIRLPGTRNITWASSLPTNAGEIFASFWDHMDRDTFNCGCDLIVISFDIEHRMTLGSDTLLSPENFLKNLTDCIGWLVPIDGNSGFIAGVSEDYEISVIPKLVEITEG